LTDAQVEHMVDLMVKAFSNGKSWVAAVCPLHEAHPLHSIFLGLG